MEISTLFRGNIERVASMTSFCTSRRCGCVLHDVIQITFTVHSRKNMTRSIQASYYVQCSPLRPVLEQMRCVNTSKWWNSHNSDWNGRLIGLGISVSDHEVTSSITGFHTFIYGLGLGWVHPASWEKLGSFLIEK